MHRLKTIGIHMRVDLRGGDIGMTEQFLHHTQIRTASEQMRGKRMPQGVGMYPADARPFGNLIQPLPEHNSINRPAGTADEHPV